MQGLPRLPEFQWATWLVHHQIRMELAAQRGEAHGCTLVACLDLRAPARPRAGCCSGPWRTCPHGPCVHGGREPTHQTGLLSKRTKPTLRLCPREPLGLSPSLVASASSRLIRKFPVERKLKGKKQLEL
ncbi:uncharacterized protein LOC144283903 [Canis aureus]